jgi:hypothetical protein
MEKELLQSLSEVAGIVQQSIPHLANHSWNSLPTLGDLQTAGRIFVQGRELQVPESQRHRHADVVSCRWPMRPS